MNNSKSNNSLVQIGTISVTPGKILSLCELSGIRQESSTEVQYVLNYEEEFILAERGLVKFETKDRTYIGLVVNPWFEGAYGIPTFACSHVYCLETNEIEAREQTFRFKNVEILSTYKFKKGAEDPASESLLNEYNTALASVSGLWFYPYIESIRKSVERQDTYWFVDFSKHDREFKATEASDTNSEVDVVRRTKSRNYFQTLEEAELNAQRMNLNAGLID